MKFSENQQKVIDTENKNILVSAAAGSGKTAVLVERIIRKICGEMRVDIDSLLVMTFTKAAAGEMRDRIAKAINQRLYEELKKGEDISLIEHLKKQCSFIQKAYITTIDSFCGGVIKNNFSQIGLDPSYRIAQEEELSLLKSDCINELLDEENENADEAFLDFIECFSTKKSDEDVIAAILKLYEFSCSKKDPVAYLGSIYNNYEVETVSELFELNVVKDYIKLINEQIRGFSHQSRNDVKICERPSGPYAYAALLEKEADDFDRIAAIDDITELKAAIDAYVFERIPSIKSEDAVDENLKLMVQKSRNARKTHFKNIINEAMGADKEVLLADCMTIRKTAKVLSDLSIKFFNRYSELKAEKQLLDFSDLEHFALRILYEADGVTPSIVADTYRKKFTEIMVDEYQDSNEVQEALITAICRDNNVFTVGDVKQSIYKFRLSDPTLFMNRMDNFPKIEAASSDDKSVRIDLRQNFRSSSKVLESANYVFEKIMHREIGDVEYDDDAKLFHGRLQEEPKDNNTELILINPAEGIDKKEIEAIAVAQRIKELVDEFEFADKDSGKLRKAKYSDIAILLRSKAGWEDVFSEILNNFDIPNHTESNTGYFTSYEIKNIMSFLSVINNPINDEVLAAALAGPFGGFDDDELSRIRLNDENGSYYEAFRKSEDEKVKKFYERIEHYRALTAYTSVGKLISLIIEDYNYDLIILAMENGEVRKNNLNALIKQADDFEKTSFRGLHDFLRYIERIRKFDIDFGESKLVGENDNCVKIMSIHKSKGLEFPIAILAGTAKEYNLMDLNASLVLDSSEGIGMDYVDPVKRIKAPSIIKKAISYKQKKDIFGEELRILYVAMTRAREKMIITGVADMESIESYANADDTYSAATIINLNSYLKLLMLSVLGNEDSPFEVRIIESEDILCAEHSKDELEEITTAKSVISFIDKLQNEKSLPEHEEYVYPYATGIFVPMKLSVSAIKKLAIEEDASIHAFDADGEKIQEKAAPVPYFISGEKKQELIGALRGTAYHRYFELLDFENYKNGMELLSIDYVNQGKITKEQYNAVRKQDIKRFIESELCKRMRQAAARGELFKEQPFSYLVKANEVNPDYPEDENIVIQGIVDAFFIEDGKIVVMDYKTDRVSDGDKLLVLYKKQLELYAKALNQITGREVSESIIYSVALGCEVNV